MIAIEPAKAVLLIALGAVIMVFILTWLDRRQGKR